MITAEDVEAAERYMASSEATPDGIRKVQTWLRAEWGEHMLTDWRLFVPEMFGGTYVKTDFAPFQGAFWDHIASIQPGMRPPPWLSVWFRGGTKSTSVEMACTFLAARRARKYGLYLSFNQDKADDHVGNVGGMLESPRMERYFPSLSKRAVGKFGNSKGWRRNRIRTESGYILDALGLDVAVRGVKIDDQRPDHIILDDIDKLGESPEMVKKKIDAITSDLLPAGSEDLAIFGAQNLIHRNGIFTQLADGRAEFLKNRIVSGPVPALRGFEYAVDPRTNLYVITKGEPTWEGFSLERCEALLNDIGPKAFKRECQHEVYEVEGAMWRAPWIDDHRETVLSYQGFDFVSVVVGVDPAVSDGPDSDETGIVVAGKARHNAHDYVLADRSGRMSALDWAKRAARAYDDFRADCIVAEANQGGDLVARNIQAFRPDIPVQLVHAKRGKELRAQPVTNFYEQGRVHHMSIYMYPTDRLDDLEAQMLSWVPGQEDSPDRVDALVYAVTKLSIGGAIEMDASTYVDNRSRPR